MRSLLLVLLLIPGPVLARAQDTTPPVVTFTVPATATLGTRVILRAVATDAHGIASLRYTANGMSIQPAPDGGVIFLGGAGVTWTITVTARDPAGNTTRLTRSIVTQP